MRDTGSDADLSLRWGARGLAVVAAAIALVTAGWPLANLAVSGSQPLVAGRTLVLGPSPAHSARITVGRGWSLAESGSNPKQDYLLRLGAVGLTIRYVSLLGRGQAGRLWAGLRQIIEAEHPGSRLGAPRLVSAAGEEQEDTGSLAEGSQGGQAMILPDLPEDFAIEVTILAPAGADAADRRAAARVAASLRLAALR